MPSYDNKIHFLLFCSIIVLVVFWLLLWIHSMVKGYHKKKEKQNDRTNAFRIMMGNSFSSVNWNAWQSIYF